jgi:hypothetical protein
MSWGAIGFAANVLTFERVSSAVQALTISLPLAMFGSLIVTRVVSSAIHRLLPLHESSARRSVELLGAVGEVIYTISETSGMASVRDEQGNLQQIACRIDTGGTEIPKGAAVKLVAYNAKQKLYHGVATSEPIAGARALAQPHRR